MTLPMPRGRQTAVLGVFAHPDDETFFAGSTLAAYAAAGCTVRLATLTGGEAFGPVQLDRYAAACRALGARGEHVRPGHWKDLGREESQASLASADLADVVSAVGDLVSAFRPDVLITNDAGGVTGHRDHIRAHAAVLAARGDTPVVLAGCLRAADVTAALARLAELAELAPGQPIGSGGVHGVPDDAALLELDLPPAAKAEAMEAYYPGLAVKPLAELVDPYTPIGDGVVLRAVADAAGGKEYFRRL